MSISWRWILGAVLIGGLGVAAYVWIGGRAAGSQEMIGFLPRTGATLVYADLGLMRKSGLLDAIAGSKAIEEAEYKRFVERTGFDYRRDLDSLAGAINGRESFFVAAGRFDWKLLEKYIASQGGSC